MMMGIAFLQVRECRRARRTPSSACNRPAGRRPFPGCFSSFSGRFSGWLPRCFSGRFSGWISGRFPGWLSGRISGVAQGRTAQHIGHECLARTRCRCAAGRPVTADARVTIAAALASFPLAAAAVYSHRPLEPIRPLRPLRPVRPAGLLRPHERRCGCTFLGE